MWQLNPLTLKRWHRFKSIRRGYYSYLALMALLLLALMAELLSNHRPLLIQYQDQIFLPTYGAILPGTTFGFDYEYETDYRELNARFKSGEIEGRMLMPPIPWGPLESDLVDDDFPPHAPSLARRHYLGTDGAGRDVLSRLLYGFRTAMGFSLTLLVATYSIGVAIGCIMGYVGGKFDLLFQRVIEIWSNVPFLYVIMIVASILPPGYWTLVLIMVFFEWTGITWYMRTATYKESSRDYVMAARALGASHSRIIFRHILPNSVSTLITFVPFAIAGGITSLTALDYLGFGLQPPAPSWGELLQQGTEDLDSAWIVSSVVGAMTLVLMLVTWIGEAVREAFDPRKFSYYE